MAIPENKRVIIGKVLPSFDCGQYAAKVVVHHPVTISADIFTDGVHKIAACITLRHANEDQWDVRRLEFVENDRWETTIIPDKLGAYYFRVQAWIDDFSTWQESIEKKYKSNQRISVDLKEGVAIARTAMAHAGSKNKKVLQRWADELDKVRDEKKGFAMSQDKSISDLLYVERDTDRVTFHPWTFVMIAEPVRAAYSTWYEMFPRSASAEEGRHGTFRDVIRLLPRIARMGFDVLYMPPIHPIGLTHRKGKDNATVAQANDPGSPWAIGNEAGGHKAIHQQLGTLDDFKELIVQANRCNIAIAMDIAFQCSPDHPCVKEHPQWFKWRADGTVQYAENPPKKYEDILPLNFDTEDWKSLWKELKSIVEYWADNGVNIFRVDNPHTKALPFWSWALKRLKTAHPQLIFLSEAFTRPRVMEHLAKIGFTQSYTYFAWRNSRKELEDYLTELTKTDLQYYFRPNFWPTTPDILTPALVEGKENAHIIRLILAATMSSNYGIYAPVYELGVHEAVPGKEEYLHNEKYEIKNWDWHSYTKIREIIMRINRIRRENSALQKTNNIAFAATDSDYIICYVKEDAEQKNTLIIAVNLDPYNTRYAHVSLPLEKLRIAYEEPFMVHDLLSGEKYHWQGEKNFVALNPYDLPAHILRLTRVRTAPAA